MAELRDRVAEQPARSRGVDRRLRAINQNDFTKALKRIDAETSDYYVIGYYSSNPDPTKKRRRIDVNVTRPNVSVLHRTDDTLKAPPVPRPAPAKITKPTDKDKDKKGGEG